jgi:hypothetical protein
MLIANPKATKAHELVASPTPMSLRTCGHVDDLPGSMDASA